MKVTRPFFLIIPFCLFGCLFFVSCANIIPPGGGPRDTIPPHLIASMPKDSSRNVNTQNIVITFDEYVDLQSVSENLIVQPYPKNTPLVDAKRSKIQHYRRMGAAHETEKIVC